jgi:hypothetical protein
MAVEETEYAGFIPTQPINWADLTEDLAGKVYQIGEERQKKREELDKIAADNQKLLNNWEPGKNQTLNQLVLRGADQGRTLIKQWNDQLKAGQISATDYKNRMNNVSEYWGVLANSAKTYDARYLEIVKRQQEGVASDFEIEMYNMFGNMSNLSDMTTQFDDEGRVYMAKTDPKTGKIIGDLYDVRTMNIPDNIYANKVKVNEQVTGLIKDWEPKTIFKDLGRGGELNIESVKQQDSYKVMVERVVNTVAPDSNPRAQISVLVDNGVIPAAEYYRTKDEYDTKKNAAIQREIQIKQQAGLKDVNLTKDELAEIELSLVQVTQDRGGLIIPVLNEQQRKAAKDRARGEVDIQLAEKISGSPQQRWTGGGGGDDLTAAEKNELNNIEDYQRGYVASLDAFGMNSSGQKTKSPDFSGLDDNFQYKYENGKVKVYKMGSLSESGGLQSSAVLVKTISDPKGLAQYTVYGKSPAEATTNYEKGRAQYRRALGLEGAKPKTNVPKATSQSDFNNRWSKLKKGQKLIGPDGKTYTKG